LRQQARGTGLTGFADENRAETKPAADCFFNDAEALNGAFTRSGQFPSAEGQAQFFQQRVVAAFDAAQAVAAGISRIFQRWLLLTDHTRHSAASGCSWYLNSRK